LTETTSYTINYDPV